MYSDTDGEGEVEASPGGEAIAGWRAYNAQYGGGEVAGGGQGEGEVEGEDGGKAIAGSGTPYSAPEVEIGRQLLRAALSR